MIRICVIYMASGFGKRFGKNKLLEELQGKKVFLYGLERLVEWQNIEAQKIIKVRQNKEAQKWREKGRDIMSKKEVGERNKTEPPKLDINIVLVSQYKEILDTGKKMGAICVENRQAAEGITASIRLGLEANGEADYYMFSVADQPWLERSTVEDFIWKFLEVSERYSIGCLCARNSKGGNPVIFHRRYQGELLALRGDKGGSQVMKRYPKEVFRVLAEETEVKDIDVLSDLVR